MFHEHFGKRIISVDRKTLFINVYVGDFWLDNACDAIFKYIFKNIRNRIFISTSITDIHKYFNEVFSVVERRLPILIFTKVICGLLIVVLKFTYTKLI